MLLLLQDSYQPTEVCEGLWIVPDWCDPPQPDALNIRMAPGLAFGTGHSGNIVHLPFLTASTHLNRLPST